MEVPPPRASAAAVPVRHRSWAGSWTEIDCATCGRRGQWPQPEFECPCGVTVRLAAGDEPPPASPRAAVARPPFEPLTIRTAYDAVACAARYLDWLGFAGVRTAVPRPGSVVGLTGQGVVGLVDPTTAPTGPRRIETLWLHGMAEGALAVAFALAGYDRRARGQADALRVPLFVLDLTGTPQPVNEAAEELVARGAGGAA
ncbi:hypothetical protein [Streptomyces hoynatensis]|uniref:hypothetical protein n=1 Tax=Streptomyces hoynatensis TaxID=1141874 RepID=UPI0030C7CF9A